MDKREQAIKAGIASGLARQTPQLLAEKAEAIRLHVELDYGIQAICTKTGINKGRARRWLIAAGVYRTGHRPRSRDYGQARGPWKYKQKPIAIKTHQKRAWQCEWKTARLWDNEAHWIKHPGVAYLRHKDAIRNQVLDYYESKKNDIEWLDRRRAKSKEYNRKRRIALGVLPRAPRRLSHSKSARRLRKEVSQFLTKGKPGSRLGIVGCTQRVLSQWIESQFTDGMGWHNKNTKGGNDSETWQIDHVVPCASFDLTLPQDRARCFHFTNLQPLWSCDNHAKGCTV